jgi:hypothetical protein
MWTRVVIPASKGSIDGLQQLFVMYESSICSLIRQNRMGLSEDEIKDLYQRFAETCLRREFLKNVDRSKGRFRHFLWVCVRRFLIDDAKRKPVPGNKNDTPIDVGGEEDDTIQLPSEGSDEWVALDEPWALAIETAGLKKVELLMDRRGLRFDCRMALLKRLKAQQDEEETLRNDAIKIQMDPNDYNNLYYPYRDILRGAVHDELKKQVRSSELKDEFNHLILVLTRIRRNELE